MSDVGEIIGRLRLDDSDWNAKLDAADAKARELSGVDPKIVVKTEGTGAAITQLDAVKVAEDRVEQSTRKVSAAQKDGQKQAVDWQSALIGGLVAVSAAAPPVVAAAVGITGAFGAMGVAGALGLAGIVRGLKENDAVGQQYRGTVAALTTDLHSLQDSSANGLFPGVAQSTSLLSSQLPTLNAEVGHFAGMLGAELPVGLDAVVTLIERANPLFDAAGNFLSRMVLGVDNFAHSSAYTDFLTYSIQSLPEVEKFLGDTVHLVGDFITAWAPLGTQTLPMLDGLVTGVDDIVKHTGPLVPGIIAVVGAYKLLSPAIEIVKSLAAATAALGEAEAGASAAGVGIAGGAAVVGIAGTQYAQQAAAGANYSNAQKLTPGSAAKKQSVASAASLAAMQAPSSAGGGGMVIPGMDQMIEGAEAKERKLATATASTTKVQAVQVQTSAQLAASLNMASTALNQVYAAEQKSSTAAVAAELGYDGMKDAIAGVTAAVKTNGTSLDQNTTKGRANREQIAQSVQTIDSYASSMSNGGKDAAKFTQIQYTQAAALEKTMVQAGMTKTAAAQYIGELLHIPAKKATTLQLEAAAAKAKLDAFRAEWDAMQSKTISLGLFASSGTKNDSGITSEAHAYGGTVGGGGTATSDSVSARLSRGEEVISDAFGGATAMRPLLKAVSAGKVKTAAQAMQYLGGGAAQAVHMHFTSDGSHDGDIAAAAAEAAVARYEAAAYGTARGGYRSKGVLGGPGS